MVNFKNKERIISSSCVLIFNVYIIIIEKQKKKNTKVLQIILFRITRNILS